MGCVARCPARRALRLAFALIPALLGVCGCGGSSVSSTTSSTSGRGVVVLSARSISGLGTVLVDSQGRTLYTFAPDKAQKVTCTGACAGVWPPLKVGAGQKPSASGAVKASLLSSDPDPSGGRVVTYNGWPLYLYAVDALAGTDHGQAVLSAGGRWYAIAPSGARLKKHVKNGVKPPHY